MAQVNTILEQRLKKKDHSSKMNLMAQQSVHGNLTGFAGIFSLVELSEKEKKTIEEILQTFAVGSETISQDLEVLISLTSEVKAINNQAAILHGERIKKAHAVLTRYKDGAFTAWLMAAYGNRQTPYNFFRYYEFYEDLPASLRPKLEIMPRQAIYTLASRDGALDIKQKIVEDYQGATKGELLEIIREMFPLQNADKRAQNFGNSLVAALSKLATSIRRRRPVLTPQQKQAIKEILKEINTSLS